MAVHTYEHLDYLSFDCDNLIISYIDNEDNNTYNS